MPDPSDPRPPPPVSSTTETPIADAIGPPPADAIHSTTTTPLSDALAGQTPESLSEQIQFEAFGDGFESAIGVGPTNQIITDFLVASRSNTPPADIQAWECRIGASRFYVPPVSVTVSTTYKAGAFGTGALRAVNSPKFNTGHSETVISMTLYFPNSDVIWGFAGDRLEINFDEDDDSKIDYFLGSLRGLITQFKYAPFLPIKNAFINSTYNITGVVMHSMTVSTVEGYPFVVAVNLNMLKFNHKVYLPMIEQFQDSFHWGRFRQYMGRAAQRMAQVTDKNFLTETLDQIYDRQDQPNATVKELSDLTQANLTAESSDPLQVFSKTKEWLNGKNFDLYYPARDPLRVIVPDDHEFKTPQDEAAHNSSWWSSLLGLVGIDVTGTPEALFNNLVNYNAFPGGSILSNEVVLLKEYLNTVDINYTSMSMNALQDYVGKRITALGLDTASDQTKREKDSQIKQAWFAVMYEKLLNDPFLQKIFDYQEFQRGSGIVKEWEVPMLQLGLDPTKVFVQGISVSLSNNIARLQLQLQDEPVHQHIGGGDTRCDISLIIYGESELIKIRQVYENIQGMARLEHGHGVLGFLGIKNILSALCGMKYVIPQNFETQTVEGYPHIYNVVLSFLDFDIFQEKREQLSSDQQADLIEAFSKRNPFLRVKQYWGVFNCYPDMPLSIRDENGKINGQLDPDFYFRSFQTIDDDIVEWDAGQEDDPVIHHTLGGVSADGSNQIISTSARTGVSMHDGFVTDTPFISDMTWNEMNADRIIGKPTVPDLTPLSGYMKPHADGSGDPTSQFGSIMKDAQYRDRNGRMVRAFPTYMLWLIDEGGMFAGVKLFDNFYGLQSVIDFSLVESEDIMADTLILRISNLYSRLSTRYRDMVDDTIFADATIINTQLNRERNLLSGFTNYVVKLESIELKPGVRIHLRMGYGANPNSLETVFNGVIAEVENGEIVTVTAQSDAVELSAIINNDDEKGDSGKIDGSIFGGFYMSEPRDLMCRLLSMGASTKKEEVAHATRGRIFSENKWGIRHFGNILYEPMTKDEQARSNSIKDFARDGFQHISDSLPKGTDGGIATFVDTGILDLGLSLWSSFTARRDLELYKRNIYPGNGLGVAQYMGGDLGDGGTYTATLATGIDPTGQATLPTPDLSSIAQDAQTASALDKVGWAVNKEDHPFLQAIGWTKPETDDDVPWFNEVHFRCSTYMKSVWDIFETCAALLPNYIVAVRPFEHRSTIFYGKPHWQYTSGVIPLSKGIPKDKEPAFSGPDSEMAAIMKEVQDAVIARQNSNEGFLEHIASVTDNILDPNASTSGAVWNGGDINALPLTHAGGGIIPVRQGKMGQEMHLPTDADARLDIQQHKQLASLPADKRHPLYMDKEGGGHGGDPGFDPNHQVVPGVAPGGPGTGVASPGGIEDIQPGARGAFGYLDPTEEQYYCNMLWPYSSDGGGHKIAGQTQSMFAHKKVMVYNNRTQRACICVPGEYGPNARTGKSLGVSPDTFSVLNAQENDPFTIGWVDDSMPVGSIDVSGNLDPQTGMPSAPQTSVDGGTSNPRTAIPGGTTTGGNYIPDWMRGDSRAVGDDLDPNRFALVYGWDDPKVPHDFTELVPGVKVIDDGPLGREQIPTPSLVDRLGTAAAEVYVPHKNEKEGEEIWDEFRENFRKDWGRKKVIELYDQNQLAANPAPPRVTPGIAPGGSTAGHVDPPPASTSFDSLPQATKDAVDWVVDQFMKFMWDSFWNRGWLVKTTDANFNVLQSVGSLVPGSSILGSIPGTDLIPGDPFGGADGPKWDPDRAHQAFDVYLDHVLKDGNNSVNFPNALADDGPVVKFMQENQEPGKTHTDLVGGLIENFKRDVIDNIVQVIADVTNAVGTAVTAAISFARYTLMTLTQGLSMASNMAKYTNLLNRTFNDSIYYSYTPGSLMYYADNPFTREFGEPVIEVRQPFQRVHYLSSFGHIISNNIQETTDENVPTVVSALSNGEHKVTVYFDKGIPTERQREVVVDTGLLWDKPGGLFDAFTHPLSTLRSWVKDWNVSSDETSSKRVALWHLKNGLKDIYGGELVVLGDATIRPYDLVYLSDVYERMYGMFEVEQVVHHFTPETGFITSITPNAIVTVNDPARWSLLANMRASWSIHHLRDDMRHMLGVNVGSGVGGVMNQIYGDPTGGRIGDSFQQGDANYDYSITELANMLETQVRGHLQYTGGTTGLVSDLAAATSTGILAGGVAAGLVGGAAGGLLAITGAWKAWSWIKDNLLDQHGCYISYLTRNGRPMDGGLQDNSGVAVGQMHAMTLFSNSLRIHIPIKDGQNTRITRNELLESLGWHTKDVLEFQQEVDMFRADIASQVLKLSLRNPSNTPFVKNDVIYAKVINVLEGDVIEVSPLAGDIGVLGNRIIRLASIDAPDWKSGGFDAAAILGNSDPGYIAYKYTYDRLIERNVALRINPTHRLDAYGRTLAWIFHTLPGPEEDTVETINSHKNREDTLMLYAGSNPNIEWDSFLPDGKPYTFNWELVLTGHAVVDLRSLTYGIPSEAAGALGIDPGTDPRQAGPH